jgi:hypothetical protein
MSLRGKAALLLAAVALLLSSCVTALPADRPEDSVPRAVCGPGDRPETGMQGQVPLADRISGRSTQGYNCNLHMVANYQGSGQATVGASYGHCLYLGSLGLGSLRTSTPGVQVVDMSDPAHPRLSTILNSPAMVAGTWETLKVHPGRGLLVGTAVPLVFGGLFLSVYDVSQDCAHPRLLNADGPGTLAEPLQFTAHEGGFSPDGRTYWTTGNAPGTINAFDLTDPTRPRIIFQGQTGNTNHGFGISADGRRIYVASELPAGIGIFDISDIQDRKPYPAMRHVGSVTWWDGMITQHAIPITSKGHPYLFVADEFDSGGVRLIDIADETHPVVVRRYEMEINRPSSVFARNADTHASGIFGYEAHYCSVDRADDPTLLACGYTQEGIRVFDVKDVLAPREIAYFNPPARIGDNDKLVNSAHAVLPVQTAFSNSAYWFVAPPSISTGMVDLSADWCMSPPRIEGNRLWVSCDDNGALVLELTGTARR